MSKPLEVHPDTSRAADMPYAPAVRGAAGAGMVFISGATAVPLYHRHPHVADETACPDDIKEQTRRTMENIELVLDAEGLTFRDVVKVTKYLTDLREADDMHAVLREYFGDWKPASTMVGVNNLSSPGARVELDMIALGSPSQ